MVDYEIVPQDTEASYESRSNPRSSNTQTTAADDTELTEGTHPAEIIAVTGQTVKVAIGADTKYITRRLLKTRLPVALHTKGSQFSVEMRAGNIEQIKLD